MCNTNYLADMICPGCGFEEEFDITSLATAHVRDDEFFIEFSDFQWQRTNRCTCPECGFKGHVRDFVLASFCRAYGVQLKQPPAKVSAYPRAVRIILISNRDNCIFKLFRPAYAEGLMTVGEVFLDLVSAYQANNDYKDFLYEQDNMPDTEDSKALYAECRKTREHMLRLFGEDGFNRLWFDILYED